MEEYLIFELLPLVRDKETKEIIHLRTKEPLKVTWRGNIGEVLGREFQQLRKDGTSYKRNIGEPVIFEKDGKRYNIFVKINEIRRGFWRDTANSYSYFVHPDSPYEIYHQPKSEKNFIFQIEIDKGGWKFGRIWLTFGGVVFLLGLILAFFLWKKS